MSSWEIIIAVEFLYIFVAMPLFIVATTQGFAAGMISEERATEEKEWLKAA